MKTFDITCTATLRPELLKKTLESFNKNLFGKHAEKGRLIINIDMIGNDDPYFAKVQIFNILKKMPYRQKIYNICDEPNFAKAFCWTMSHLSPQNEYVFNLEEDWELMIPIGFENMMKIMDKYKDLAHLRLSQFKSEENHIKAWQNFARWNGEFYEYLDEDAKSIDGWAGHPSLNRSAFMKAALKLINPRINPEKQISGSRMESLFAVSRFGIFHYRDHGPSIKDLGREWMVKHGYIKADNKAWFTQWERV